MDFKIVSHLLFILLQDLKLLECTPAVICEDFGTGFTVNTASRTTLKKNSQNLLICATPEHGIVGSSYFTLRTEFFVEKIILLGYFKAGFLDPWGRVVYVLEHCGKYFSVFLFLKLLRYMAVTTLRYMQVDKMTRSAFGLGKTLLSASYKIFHTTVLTSMYSLLLRKRIEHLYPAVSAVTVLLSTV